MIARLMMAGLLAGCAGPEFVLPEAPAVTDPSRPPAVPKATRRAPEGLASPVTVDEARAPSAPALADPRVAILPIDTPDSRIPEATPPTPGPALVGNGPVATMGAALTALLASPGQAAEPPRSEVAALAERMLPMTLLRAGVTRLLGPDQLRAVSAEKQSKRDSTIVWRASLARLIQVEPATNADLLLGLRVTHAAPEEAVLEVGYTLDADALDAYTRAYGDFEASARRDIQLLRATRDDYARSFEAAKEDYADHRGKYGGDEPTSGDRALAEGRAQLARLDTRLASLQDDLARLPAPAELAADTAARREEVRLPAYAVTLEATVVDARDLRVLWLATLSTRDAALEPAMQRVLDRVVQEVRPAPAPALP